jgi:hypothetical protein
MRITVYRQEIPIVVFADAAIATTKGKKYGCRAKYLP